MLYNEYNDNNQYAINIMSIAIVFLEIFTFSYKNLTYFQKPDLIRLVEFFLRILRKMINFECNYFKKY